MTKEAGFKRAVELAAALAALGASLWLNRAAGRLADTLGSHAHTAPDLLLGWLPFVDTRLLFVWGFAGFVALAVGAGALRERRRAAYLLWIYALLISVRSFFIILTPMQSPEGAPVMGGDWIFDVVGRHLVFRHDLFFSSHTALPFLGYLVFRDRWVRLAFLGLSVLMAATVLLGRFHYSIDVFAAYFITYAVYRGEIRWFRGPYRTLRRRWIGPPRPPAP